MGVSRMSRPIAAQSQRKGLAAGLACSRSGCDRASVAMTPMVASASTGPKKSRCSSAMAGTATPSLYGA